MKSLHLKILIGVFLLCIFSAIFLLLRSNNAKADSFSLYASDCSGGFDNTENASGTPSVSGFQISKFNELNSAVLPPNRNGDIKCTGFAGNSLYNVTPKKVDVKFSWAATYSKSEIIIEKKAEDSIITPIFDSSSTPLDSTSSIEDIKNEDIPNEIKSEGTSSQEEIRIEEPKTEILIIENSMTEDLIIPTLEKAIEDSSSVPQVEQPQTPTGDSVSFLRFLGRIAFAQEFETTTASDTVTIFPEEDVPPIRPLIEGSTSTSASTSSSESYDYGIVGVEYSNDGILWSNLGNVDIDKFSDATFELPLVGPIELSTLKNIQIRASRLPSSDGVSAYIYIDSIWLDVEYNKEPVDPHPIPSVEMGDVFGENASYDTYTAFIVNRPLEEHSSLTTTNIDLLATSTEAKTKYKTELWIKNEIASTSISWVYLAGEDQVGSSTKLFFQDGYVFWIDNSHNLSIYNPSSSSNSSMTLLIDRQTQYTYSDSAGNKKVMIIDQPNNVIEFQDYIEEVNNQ